LLGPAPGALPSKTWRGGKRGGGRFGTRRGGRRGGGGFGARDAQSAFGRDLPPPPTSASGKPLDVEDELGGSAEGPRGGPPPHEPDGGRGGGRGQGRRKRGERGERGGGRHFESRGPGPGPRPAAGPPGPRPEPIAPPAPAGGEGAPPAAAEVEEAMGEGGPEGTADDEEPPGPRGARATAAALESARHAARPAARDDDDYVPGPSRRGGGGVGDFEGGRNPRLKQRPQDFQVREVVDLPTEAESAAGAPEERPYFLHRLTKKKLTTPEAVALIARRFGIAKSDIAFGGLKDKQSLSEQIISIKGRAIEHREGGLKLTPVGRRATPISSEDVKANRFRITVRGLQYEDLRDLAARLDDVRAHGYPNYFDSQRFGSVRFGQGFLARSLVGGDPEEALRLFMATPSPRDHSRDKFIKQIIAERWGEWEGLARRMHASPYGRILGHLAHAPTDFWGAVGYMSRPLRALHLFAYQSLLWNNSAIFFLRARLRKDARFTVPYQCGRLAFYRRIEPAEFEAIRDVSVPLVGPDTRIEDPVLRDAVERALATEGVRLEAFRLPESAGGFFREEPRPLVVTPARLEVTQAEADELNPGRKKLDLLFELPRGAYGTLLVKRLFRG
jgi:tRNA pseudouridine13 synthase